MRQYLLLLLLLVNQPAFSESAVTPGVWNHGRLGDHLRLYFISKWVAYKHKLPFLHKPFPKSKEFKLHYKETPFTQQRKYKSVVNLKEVPRELDNNSSTLYEIDYFFKFNEWKEATNDVEFMNEIKKMIQPHKALRPFKLPDNIITVAVHVRKGGGYDEKLYGSLLSVQQYTQPSSNTKQKPHQHADQRWPTKFPPDQYYIDQIVKLSEMLNDQPIYLHIFTDHKKPLELVERYKKAVNKDNITYHTREKDNRHDKNVLEDLFAMAQFDCLIRGNSHFSLISQLIGNHIIAIHPVGGSAKWIGNKLIIDQVNVILNNQY